MPTIDYNPDGSLPYLQIQEEIYKLADEYAIDMFPANHREHLGVSLIGEKCYRKLFYGFRWVKLIQAEPRVRRLWNRGHREEEEFGRLLSWMGFFNRSIDPVTNKQYVFSKLNGHYGGSTDTLALLPWFRDNNGPRILAEYKTHNKKQFDNLVIHFEKTKRNAEGIALKLSQPKHYAQMCGYGAEFQAKYGLYCAVCKDDDRLHFEFFPLDWNYAIELENKAKDIITAFQPPPKISENPSTFECQYCAYQDICHWGEAVERNCRSCKFGKPIENGKWFCTRFNQGPIPDDFLKKGCDQHSSINE